jgi:hypothetical protein
MAALSQWKGEKIVRYRLGMLNAQCVCSLMRYLSSSLAGICCVLVVGIVAAIGVLYVAQRVEDL